MKNPKQKINVKILQNLFNINGLQYQSKNYPDQLVLINLTSTLFLVLTNGRKSKYPYYFLFKSIETRAGQTVT